MSHTVRQTERQTKQTGRVKPMAYTEADRHSQVKASRQADGVVSVAAPRRDHY